MVPEKEAEQVTEKCSFGLKGSESVAFKALECGNKEDDFHETKKKISIQQNQ